MAFKNEEFRKITLKAIGNSSRAEFARKCGITPQHLSRLMSEKNDVTPSRTTLQKIADNSPASLEELLVACGYLTTKEESRLSMSAKERAERNADDMIAGFNDLTKNTRLYQSLNDFLEDYNMFYGNEDVKFGIGEKTEYLGDRYVNAEYYAPVVAIFNAKHIECKTWLIIYFCETKGGKYIITNVSLSGKDLLEAGVVSTSVADLLYEDGEDITSLPYLFTLKRLPEVKTPEERLLDAIFGDHSDEEEFPYNIVGFGFELYHCPERFNEFLKNHKDSFCKDNYTTGMFKNIVEEGKNSEIVLSKLEDSYTADFGYGAAISSVLREETDIKFGWYVDENNEKGCVMLSERDMWHSMISDAELKEMVYQYAKELGLREYGECVCLKMMAKDPARIYKIEEDV